MAIGISYLDHSLARVQREKAAQRRATAARRTEGATMAARMTLERVLRDPDDASAQTVRQWSLEIDGDHITINGRPGGLRIRRSDVEQLCNDLRTIAAVTVE